VIPRTKVSYRLGDLLGALVASGRRDRHRAALAASLAVKLGGGNVLLTASGRGALYIILSVLPQRKVLVPAYTCKAVVEAARLAGKEVVYGESEDDGINMDPEMLAGRLDADTVLIATHQFGIPCAIESMVEVARSSGAYVIEDAAASLGTRVNGKLTGTFGDAAIFSFDSTKLVNVPLKGGFLLVQDRDLGERCRAFAATATRPMPLARKVQYLALGAALVMLEHPRLYRLFHNLKFRWRGRFTDDQAESNAQLGPYYCDRLAEWQAKIILPQIDRIEETIVKRRQIYGDYRQRLRSAAAFSLPPEDAGREWAPIRFPIRANVDKMELYRRAVDRGVDFAFSFTFIASPRTFGKAHALADSVLDLPFYDRLSEAELEHVGSVMNQIDQDISRNKTC
jgi:dTDP-4-amino-4,6-dideoxygalactose transaminase